ncbi:hypothetical protein C8J57DRAFT_1562065 [Mycena rebaudengoi]|nr:hypothetical protein C8J57DRAFT_1562065 [Mycena rebaudengoi]
MGGREEGVKEREIAQEAIPFSADPRNEIGNGMYIRELPAESIRVIHSDHSELDGSEDPELLSEDDSDAESHKSAIDSLEENQSMANISCDSGDESQECIGQVDHGVHNAGSFQAELNADPSSHVYQDSAGGTVGHQQHASSPPLTETLLEQLKERRVALRGKERELGDDHEDTLDAMESLGWTYFDLGQFRQAKVLQVTVFENLAWTHSKLGQLEKATELETSALEKQRELLGEDHPDTLCSMCNLAGTYTDLGQFTKAEAIELKVLEKRKQLLGVDSPDTLHISARLASTYCRMGRLEEAQALLVSVLDRQRKLLGEDRPDTLWTMARLAGTYGELGQWQKAKGLFIRVPQKRKEMLGGDHSDTLWSMNNLAATYYKLDQFQQAEELWAEALEKRRKLLGEDHPNTIWTMRNLALTYRKLDKVHDAEDMERLVAYHDVSTTCLLVVLYHPTMKLSVKWVAKDSEHRTRSNILQFGLRVSIIRKLRERAVAAGPTITYHIITSLCVLLSASLTQAVGRTVHFLNT